MSNTVLQMLLDKQRQPVISTNNECTYTLSRNPNLAKWNILFDKDVSEWMSFKPKYGLEVYPCYACRNICHKTTRGIATAENGRNISELKSYNYYFYNFLQFFQKQGVKNMGSCS